jgi:hypothetical protein
MFLFDVQAAPVFLIFVIPKQPAPKCLYRVGIVCFVIPSRFVRPFVPAGLSFSRKRESTFTKNSFYSLRLFYKNRRSLKRNNVRNYINIKHGFPFSWE